MRDFIMAVIGLGLSIPEVSSRGPGGFAGGGGGAPASPSLDFSNANNSQYVALIFGGYWGV